MPTISTRDQKAMLTALVSHQNILIAWQAELSFQTSRFFQNVDDFHSFVQNTESHLVKERLRLQQDSLDLATVRVSFHEILPRIERLLNIEPGYEVSQQTFIHRLTIILEKLQEDQIKMNESKRETNHLQAQVQSFRSREEKLASLANKLKDLSTELEAAIMEEPSNSEPECTYKEEEDTGSVNDNEMTEFLEQAHEDLESYCNYRRDRDNEIFKRNYIRFKRSGCEPLDNLLNLVEKELFHLWIQEDRAKLNSISSHRTVCMQTEPENVVSFRSKISTSVVASDLQFHAHPSRFEKETSGTPEFPPPSKEKHFLGSWQEDLANPEPGKNYSSMITIRPYLQVCTPEPEPEWISHASMNHAYEGTQEGSSGKHASEENSAKEITERLLLAKQTVQAEDENFPPLIDWQSLEDQPLKPTPAVADWLSSGDGSML